MVSRKPRAKLPSHNARTSRLKRWFKPFKQTKGRLIQHIDTLIRRKLSPEQVCAYLRKHHGITLHHSTIYRYLRQDKSNGGTLWQHLRICRKPYRKRYGSTWTRGKVPDRVGIENRPAIVDQKTRIGDWEADLKLIHYIFSTVSLCLDTKSWSIFRFSVSMISNL